MTKPIIVVGSINMDLVATVPRLPAPGETLIGDSFATYHGGKGANQAFAAARLGARVRMIGAVGSDAFGAQLRQSLTDGGVDTGLVDVVDGPSGTALIATGGDGENMIVVVPGANGAVTPRRLEAHAGALAQAGLLLAQLEIPLESIEWLAAFAARHAIPLILDLAPAPTHAMPPSILRGVAWLTPNESEAAALVGDRSGDTAERLMAMGAANVVLKLGAAGCIVAERGRAPIRLEAMRVDAVDTTAAGDAFNAGFAVGLLRGYDAGEAARLGVTVAGLSVTKRGAQPSMPSLQDVENLTGTALAGVA